MASDAQKRATEKYDKANTKQIMMKLNKGTDADILEKLASVPNVQGYIKELIRADMARGK
ncbi:MAG: hypothetical protein IKF16_12145 [Lachnospiraceae bacterium]|jgi:hypothetical protein|nr:hypothetical protein [Lachnospiraceae bacterium]